MNLKSKAKNEPTPIDNLSDYVEDAYFESAKGVKKEFEYLYCSWCDYQQNLSSETRTKLGNN